MKLKQIKKLRKEISRLATSFANEGGKLEMTGWGGLHSLWKRSRLEEENPL